MPIVLAISLLSLLGAAPTCVVARVIDGDTFRCRDGTRVRLIGIDSPERGQGTAARAAAAALARWLPRGRRVRLERDVAATDRYGRTLAWVWVADTLVNEAMIRAGWALLYTVPPNVKYVDRLTRAQRAAREAGAGLWRRGEPACPPDRFRRKECAGL